MSTGAAPPRFTVRPTAEAVAGAAADRIVEALVAAIEERGTARIALSGGSTPKRVYPELLAPRRRDVVDWSRVEAWFGDERTVPPDHPDSNFGVAYGQFLSQLPAMAPERIHRMPAEAADLDAAAAGYEAELRLAFEVRGDERPAFDLVWLGMGPDGHTASLFPGSPALRVEDRLVVGNWAPSLETWRMTLTFPAINAARLALFVVTGEDKADALREIREGASDLPAARVRAEATEWIVDDAAAAEDRG